MTRSETAAAMAKGGMLFGICQLAATFWSLVMGPLLDRIDRLTGFIIAMAIASVAYFFIFTVEDPFGAQMIPAVILLGVAEMSTIIAGQVLITQEAPAHRRGSVVGLFSLFGAAGIMVATSIGGVLFDKWTATGPFALMGVVNVLVLIWALMIKHHEGKADSFSMGESSV